MRRTRRWREVDAQLTVVGVTLGQQSLLLDAPTDAQLGYHVPSDVHVLEDRGIKWFVWDGIDQTQPNDPSERAALPGFVRLADAHDSAVLRFARLWGPLGNGWRRAVPHEFPAFPPSIGELVRGGDELQKVFEPVEAWRRLARQLDALLRLAVHLQSGRR